MGLFRKDKGIENGLTQLHGLLSNSFRNVQQDTSYIIKWLSHIHQKSLYHGQLLRHLHSKNQSQEELISQLHDKNSQHEATISRLKEDLNYIPKSKAEIKKIVDEFYSFEHILSRIKELSERIEELRKSHLELHKSNLELTQKHHETAPKIESKIESLREELIAKIPQKPSSLICPHTQVAELSQLQNRLEKLESRKAAIKEKIIKRITKNSKDYIKSIILSYIKKYGKITALQLKEMVVEEQGLCSKSSFYRLLEELEEEPDLGVIKEGKEKHYIAKISKKNY